MPAALLVPAIASVAAGGVAAGATIYGSKQQGKANQRATNYQQQADFRAEQLERQQMEEDKRRWEAEQRNIADQQAYDRRWSEDDRAFTRQQYTDRENRLQPYRQAGTQALGRLSSLIGLDGGPGAGGVWRSPSNAGRASMSDLVRR